jgi:hypothetical protein
MCKSDLISISKVQLGLPPHTGSDLDVGSVRQFILVVNGCLLLPKSKNTDTDSVWGDPSLRRFSLQLPIGWRVCSSVIKTSNFYKSDCGPIDVVLDNATITSKSKVKIIRSGGVAEASVVHPRDRGSNISSDRKYFLILFMSHLNPNW